MSYLCTFTLYLLDCSHPCSLHIFCPRGLATWLLFRIPSSDVFLWETARVSPPHETLLFRPFFSLVLFVRSPTGGEFYNTFDQCTLKRFFANMGYVRHGLCRHLWLSAARSGAIHLLDASCVTPGTFGLFHFALWELLGASKCNPSKKEKGRVPWPLMATV